MEAITNYRQQMIHSHTVYILRGAYEGSPTWYF